MAQRPVTITLRDRQTTGGVIPSDAVFGEPFINLFNGVLRFSGVTGGDYEPSTQSGVFETGSKLYNQKITNRLNINDNFIISGDTGRISTYAGTSALAGKFLSGTSTGFVVADIADIAASTDSYTTGATWVPNTLTLKLNQGKPDVTVLIGTFNTLTATGATSLQTVSATTMISGSTNLYSIFAPFGTISGVETVVAGSNITTGGTIVNPTVSVVASPSFNGITFSGTAIGGTVQAGAGTFTSLSAGTLSGGTILSGATNLYSIFATAGSGVQAVQPGSNITTGGTSTSPTINLTASPSINNLSFSGIATGGAVNATSLSATSLTNTRVLFAGTNGLITDDSSLTFNSGTDVLTIGGAGNLTTNGTTYSGGTITDDGVFTIDAATNVQFDSKILPTTHLTYDIGAVGQRWNFVYAKAFHAGVASTVYGDGYLTGNSGTFLVDSGTLSVNGAINPSASTSYDLGTSGLRWNKYYGKDMDLTGALTVTGVTNSSLTAGQAVYAGTGGLLKTNSGFTYDDVASRLFTQNIQIGSSSLSGQVTIWGDVTVMGQSISAFTSQLYIEDNNIQLNYNPTASTIATSLGAGFTIQDGSGIFGTDVFFDIRGTATGVDNRSWATNLNDIRIRESGTTSSPNGVRVLAEFDVLDGGNY